MHRRRTRRSATATLATAAFAAIAGTPSLSPSGAARGQNASAPAILQMFEATYQTIERRTPDIFIAGYGGLWTPPPGRADQGNFSVGYDVYDRFDLGSAGNPTLYGTETGLKTTIREAHKAAVSVYTDLVWNHSGFSDSSSVDTKGTPSTADDVSFVQAGSYPGLAVQLPGDVDGDFHGAFESGQFRGRIPGINLIDIAQEKNHQFVRNPVPGFANNLPAGTASAFGRIANVPTESNRRFYPDLQAPSTTVNGVTYHRWSADPLAGDPVAENATGYLMRHTRWMVEEIGVDGFRLDATKHFVDPGDGNPDWVLEFYDVATNAGTKTPNLDGSSRRVFGFGEYLDGNIGLVQQSIKKTANANRDALDFALHYAMRDNLTGNDDANDWRNMVGTTQDVGDDGLAHNGSQGVAFDASHDEGGAYLGNVANAYLLMRPGNAVVYFNAKQFGENRDFPRDGRGDALGGFYGNAVTKLVDIRNTHGRGNYQERWIDKETLVYERQGALVAGYNNRLDGGYDERTVQTSFPADTKLIELTGNASDPSVDPLSDIHDMVTVNVSGQVTMRIPRNVAPGGGGAEHGKGYVIYGPATPRGSLSVTNVARTLGPETPTAATNGTARLASIDIIQSDTFDVKLATIPVVLPDASTDTQAGGDNAVLRFDGGLNLNGNAGVDFTAPGSVVYGFENFSTKKSPLFSGGDGEYAQTIDATQLSEGYHYLTARAFRQGGAVPLWSDFRKVVYVDRERPVSAIAELKVINGSSDDRDVVVRSTDQTATGVHVFHNLGANQLTTTQLVQMAASGQNTAGSYDRDLFKYGVFDLKDGNHVFTIVTFEASYNAALGYAGGGVNVQRIAGVGFNTGGGAGLGDINFDGVRNGADPNLFGNLLGNNNSSFNPAADLNADGLMGEADNILNVPWLTHLGADPTTITNATNVRLNRAIALGGTLHVPAGNLDVSGVTVTGTPLTFTSAFNIPAGATITKTGGQALVVSAPQSHGAGATLHVAEGSAQVNSNGGENLSVVTSGAGTQTSFTVSQRISAVAVGAGASAALSAGGGPLGGGKLLHAKSLTVDGKLDLSDNNLAVNYTGDSPIADVADDLKAGRNNGAWNGASGIVSSAAAAEGPSPLHALGVAEASQVLDLEGSQTALWFGQAVEATTVLVKYTYDGDANLDGKINVDDYGQIDFNVTEAGASGWYNGDFNLDGKINIDDYGIIDFNVNAQGATIPSAASAASAAALAGSVAAVPEPSAAGLFGGALLGVRRRRRHDRRPTRVSGVISPSTRTSR